MSAPNAAGPFRDDRGVYWREGPQGLEYLASDGRWYPGAPSPPRPQSRATGRGLHPAAGWVAVAAGLLLGITAFLPWATADLVFVSIDRNGFQLGYQLGFSPDGFAPLALGLCLVLVGIGILVANQAPEWLRSPGPGIAAITAGAFGLITAIAEGGSISGSSGYSVGYGLYLMGLAGLGGIVAGILALTLRSPASTGAGGSGAPGGWAH